MVAKRGAARHAVHSIPFYKKCRYFDILVSFVRALLLQSIVFLGSFLTPIENPIIWLVAGWAFDYTSRSVWIKSHWLWIQKYKTVTILKFGWYIVPFCIVKIHLEIFDLSSLVIVFVILPLRILYICFLLSEKCLRHCSSTFHNRWNGLSQKSITRFQEFV